MVSIEIDTHGPMLELIWSGKAVRMNERRRIGQKYINGKKKSIVINTNEYNKFIEDMAMLFQLNAAGAKIVGTVFVIIGTSAGSRRRIMDIDAFSKQTLDALEKSGVIENDRLARPVFLRDIGRGQTEMDTIVVWVFGVAGNERIFYGEPTDEMEDIS